MKKNSTDLKNSSLPQPVSAIDLVRQAARGGVIPDSLHAGDALADASKNIGGIADSLRASGGGLLLNLLGSSAPSDVNSNLSNEGDSSRHDQSPAKPAGADTDSPSIIKSPADLGRLVRKARQGKNLSQQQFADLAGVGRRFLSEFENGKQRLELGKALQVAAAAGIDISAHRR